MLIPGHPHHTWDAGTVTLTDLPGERWCFLMQIVLNLNIWSLEYATKYLLFSSRYSGSKFILFINQLCLRAAGSDHLERHTRTVRVDCLISPITCDHTSVPDTHWDLVISGDQWCQIWWRHMFVRSSEIIIIIGTIRFICVIINDQDSNPSLQVYQSLYPCFTMEKLSEMNELIYFLKQKQKPNIIFKRILNENIFICI